MLLCSPPAPAPAAGCSRSSDSPNKISFIVWAFCHPSASPFDSVYLRKRYKSPPNHEKRSVCQIFNCSSRERELGERLLRRQWEAIAHSVTNTAKLLSEGPESGVQLHTKTDNLKIK